MAVKIATLPAPGSLMNDGLSVTAGQFIAVSDVVAGKLRFASAANANGAGYTSFTFQVQDGGGTASGGADLDPTPNTLTVNVTPVNDAPVAVADAYSVNEDSVLTVTAAGVLATDSDIDGDPLTAALLSGPANGSLTLNANGSFTYTPNADFNGTDSFTYRANDGTANSIDPENPDYLNQSGTISFRGDQYTPATDGSGRLEFHRGETNQFIFIPIIDDLLGEGNETFNVLLSNLTGPPPPDSFANATVFGPLTNAVVTIIDNETPGSVD